MASAKSRSGWILIVFILSGLVIGGLIGEIASSVDFLWWLGYSQSFGLSTPLQLDLSILQLSFSILFKINIASIIGMAVGIFLYRKI